MPSTNPQESNNEQGLAIQDLSTLDVSKLTPLSPQVISRQATINYGTIGHVAHGKSTIVRAISGIQTTRFFKEKSRNITIRLGYANAKIYKCDNPKCTGITEDGSESATYTSAGSAAPDTMPCQNQACTGKYQLIRHVSFVDCFGTDQNFIDATNGKNISNKDVQVGTALLGPDGKPRTVTAITQGEKDLYAIKNNNRNLFTCTSGHLLCLQINKPYHIEDDNRTVRYLRGTQDNATEHTMAFPDPESAIAFTKTLGPVRTRMTLEAYLDHTSDLFKQNARMYTPAKPMSFAQQETNCTKMHPDTAVRRQALDDILRSDLDDETKVADAKFLAMSLGQYFNEETKTVSQGSKEFEFTVESLGVQPFKGFTVEGGADQQVICADNFVVAHNCPGHEVLMATMLNGTAVMDAALLLVAGNEPCPQPQTQEHLAAVEIMRLKHILIVQNKVELVKESEAKEQYEAIKKFASGTAAGKSPIIPVSAVLRYNIDVLLEYMCTQIPVPIRDFTSRPQMVVIRSFDVNRPGEEVEKLQGGVAGGSILKGVLRMGDEIEIRPGRIIRDSSTNQLSCIPIRSRIVSLFAENNALQYAVPGGLIGVGTDVDPALTRSDRLVGQTLGHPDDMPGVFTELDVSYYLLRRLLGVKSEGGDSKEGGKAARVSKLKEDEVLQLNIGSTAVAATVTRLRSDNVCRLSLNAPVCTRPRDRIALSRRIEKNWRLVGWGEIIKGKEIKF